MFENIQQLEVVLGILATMLGIGGTVFAWKRNHTKQRQANIRPELRRNGNSFKLYLMNEGAAEARNIRVELGGIPLVKHPAFPSNARMPDLVGSQGEISCVLGFHTLLAPPIEIVVVWDDDSAKDRVYRTTLTT